MNKPTTNAGVPLTPAFLCDMIGVCFKWVGRGEVSSPRGRETQPLHGPTQLK